MNVLWSEDRFSSVANGFPQHYQGGCWAMMKDMIPTLRSSGDGDEKAIIIISNLKLLLMGKRFLSPDQKKAILTETDAFLDRWKVSNSLPKSVMDVERYALAVRMRLPLYLEDNPQKLKELKEKVEAHNEKVLSKWSKTYHFPANIYLQYPDFADFVFGSFLHKSFAYFEHTLKIINGQPAVLVEGNYLSWDEIKKKFEVSEGCIYSYEDGVKVRWSYLENGLTKYDPNNWDKPRPLKVLKEKPSSPQLQIITSHVKPDQQNFMDRVLQGSRHAWFRLINTQGEVYSFGLGFDAQDFNILQPLASMKALIQSPDFFEFYADRRLETTLAITEQQAARIMQIVQENKKAARTFNYVNGNCAAFTQQILEAAGLDIPHQIHFSQGMAKLFIPNPVRKVFKALWCYTFGIFLPPSFTDFLVKTKNLLVGFFSSVILFPLITLLGGWRTTPRAAASAVAPLSKGTATPPNMDTYLQEAAPIVAKKIVQFITGFVSERTLSENIRAEVRKPLYASIWDVVDPYKLTFAVTYKIAQWQRRQGSSTKLI